VTVEVPAWVGDAVFYQIFPDRFARSSRAQAPGPLEPWDAPPTVHGFKGGDLSGIAEQLDYLADLGITALLLTPVFSSAANHRYHTVDYLHVDPLLGGDEGLRELLDAAHLRGMRVVLDGVFNHSGRGFWPFLHILEAGAASPYLDWFHLSDEARRGLRALVAYPEPAVLEALNGGVESEGSAGARSEALLGYRAWWDLPALPKLNVANPHVRAFLFSVAEHWIRFGADGWRVDVAEEISDGTFWSEFRRRVKAVNPEAYIVGEIWRVRPAWVAGDRFDGLMNYPLAEAVIGFAAGRHLDLRVAAQHGELAKEVRHRDGPQLASRLAELLGAYHPDVNRAQLNLLGSHDTPRVRTMCGGDDAAVRLATMLVMTLPGAPSIYYGDEIGLEGEHDPDCRRAFPWDRSAWNQPFLAFVRRCTSLRAEHPALRGDGYRLLAAAGEALAYLRVEGDDVMVVALNAGEEPMDLPVEAVELAGRTLVSELATHDATSPAVTVAADGRASLSLHARSGVTLRGLP